MYRPEDIKASWMELIGWRQDQDAEDIYASLQESSTGLYYQDFHPLLNLNNIQSVAPNFSYVSYTEWGETTTYAVGDRVNVGADSYKALQAGVNHDPTASPEYWQKIDFFSEWLTEKTEAAILKLMRNFWTDKLAAKTASNILEHHRFPSGTSRLEDLIAEGDKLVGYEITPIRSAGVTTKVNKIGLQFTLPGTYTVHLMHSSQNRVMKTQHLEVTKAKSLQWFSIQDWLLPYVSEDNGAGGSWYLVYDQSEIPSGSQAVNNNYDWSKSPCTACNSTAARAYSVVTRYIEVSPFETSEPFRGDFGFDFSADFNTGIYPYIWDVSKNVYQPSTNYGISLELTLECDVTDIVIEQNSLFQDAIGLQMAADMLREFAYNPNAKIGREQQNVQRTEILYELDGHNEGRPSGVNYELKQAKKGLNLDVSKLSRVCMTCGKRGLKYKPT